MALVGGEHMETGFIRDSDKRLVVDNDEIMAARIDLDVINANIAKEYGAWSYYGGDAGTVNVTVGQRVIGIGCHSTTGGSMTINGGQTVPIPANVSIEVVPKGNLVAPTIVFSGTDTYFVEVVS